MIALALIALAGATPDCSAAAVAAKVSTAADQLAANSAAAKATIEPVLACPVDGTPAYSAHVLRAQIAVQEKDWATVRAMFAGLGFHPGPRISLRAAALVLRTDQALNDTRSFAGDRAAIVAGNDGMLSRIGRKIETFAVGGATVTSYEAAIDQGRLHRKLEFIIVPEETDAYPRSILLTDDVGTAKVQSELLKNLDGGHAWFVDGYDCLGHQTIASLPGKDSPTYETVKALVIATLQKKATPISSSSRPGDGLCDNLGWILPGIGAPLPPSAR